MPSEKMWVCGHCDREWELADKEADGFSEGENHGVSMGVGADGECGPLALDMVNLAFPKDAYDEYVKRVSTAVWAISEELSRWLWHNTSGPALQDDLVVADIGSGFSSFLFRVHPDVKEVHTFETSPHWRERTEAWLTKKMVNGKGPVLSWPSSAHAVDRVDLLLFDSGPSRESMLDLLDTMVSDDGRIVFDDLHRPEYLAMVMKWAHKSGWSLEMLSSTVDRFNRFAGVATRK